MQILLGSTSSLEICHYRSPCTGFKHTMSMFGNVGTRGQRWYPPDDDSMSTDGNVGTRGQQWYPGDDYESDIVENEKLRGRQHSGCRCSICWPRYEEPPISKLCTVDDLPIRPRRSWKDGGKWQWVWPKDKPNMGKVDRLEDCLTNKGPDIFIATRWGWEQPHRPVWSGWKTRGVQHPRDMRIRWDNAGYPFRQDSERTSRSKDARQGERNGRRYDFRTRKYVRPKGGEWSDAVWDPDNPKRALYWRDVEGYEYVDQKWDWEGYNRGYGENPFRAGEMYDRRYDHPGRFYRLRPQED